MPGGGGSTQPQYLLLVGSGTDLGADPTVYADDVFAAFVAWFEGRSDLTGPLPGGVVNTRPPPSVTMPYARLGFTDQVRPTSTDDQSFLFAVSAYATSDDSAENAGNALVKAVLSTKTRPPLAFMYDDQKWIEVAVRRLPESQFSYLGYGPDGVDVYRWDQLVELSARRVNGSG